MIAVELANLNEGRPANTAGIQAVSQSKAADALQVSRDSVQQAKAIKESAPDLAAKVKSGEITVHAARQQIKAKSETIHKVQVVTDPILPASSS